MAKNTERKVLLSVDLEAKAAIKNLADLKIKADELKASQKELEKQMKAVDTTTEEGAKQYKELRIQYEATGQEIKNLNTQATTQQRIIQHSITAREAEAGSAKQVAAQLAMLRMEYDSLSKTVQESDYGTELQEKINELDESIKATDAGTGRFQRNVGNYPTIFGGALGSVSQFSDKIKALGGNATTAGGMAANAFKTMKTSVVSLGKAFLTPPVGVIVVVLGAIMLAVKKVSEAIGRSDEAGTRLQASFAALQPILTLARKGFDALALGLSYVVEGLSKAFLYVGKFAEAFGLLPSGFSEAAAAAQELVIAEDNLEQTERDYTVNSAKRDAERAKLKSKATQRDKYDAAQRIEFLKEAIDLEAQNLEDEKFIAAEHLRLLEEKAEQEVDTSDATTNKIAEARAKMYRAEEAYFSGTIELQSQLDAAMKENAKEEEDRQKKQKEQNEKALKAAKDNANKLIEAEKKTQELIFSYRESSMKQDFSSQQKFNEEKFNAQLAYEKRKLEVAKQYGEITLKEYESANEQLRIQEQTFRNTQLKELNDYFDTLQSEIIDLAGETIDSQISTIEDKYKKAFASIEKMEAPKILDGQSEEDFENSEAYKKYQKYLMNKSIYEIDLEKKKQEEIQAVRDSSLASSLSAFDKSFQARNAKELAQAADNEREKNKLAIQSEIEKQDELEQLREKGKITQEQWEIEMYKSKAQLRELDLKQAQLNNNKELLLADGNAEAKYEANKKYLNEQLSIYKDNADKRLEIEKQLLDNERELMESRIEMFEDWTSQTMEGLSTLSDLASTLEQNEAQEAEDKNERKKESLKRQLDSGLISQKEYDKKVAASDAELDKKKAEIARKAAAREKALSILQIGLNTAAAIMKIWAEVPKVDFGASTMALTAVAAALGAVQLATVMATPLPKAAKGKYLKGNSHAAGGIHIEAEGGETIINKASSKMFLPLLSAINEAGGGVPFVAPNSDGGFSLRAADRSNGFSYEQMKEAMTEAVTQVRVVTTIEDYRRADSNYSEIESASKF